MSANSSNPTPDTSSLTLTFLEQTLRSSLGKPETRSLKLRFEVASTFMTIMDSLSGAQRTAAIELIRSTLCEMSSKELYTGLTTRQALELSLLLLDGRKPK